jgi:WD40 repeat protein
MPITSVAGLVRLLEQYGLIDPERRPQLARLAQTGPKGPRGFARELLQRGWLTAYQINQLFQDNGESLLLGSYVILERLGSGGMGNVFKARHQKLGRVVAVKVIHRDKLGNVNVVKRFDREIKVAGQLDHPNIVHAYDAEEVNGARCLVMEYIEGDDLGKMVRERGPLPVREACEYVRQAALALQHAFEKGLVHRDIKPGNFMVQPAADPPGGPGTVKLLDLGLALLQQPLLDGSLSGQLTVAGKVVGTVDFIAPEQARNASNVDIRADLYSLGCTFYYLLTGLAPFGGATATNKLFKHAMEEPLAVERLRPDVPAPVAAVVRRLMAKRPEDRFQTPAELAAVLGDLLHGRSSLAVPAGDGVAAKRPGRGARAAGPAPIAVPVGAAPVRRRWWLLNAAGAVVLVLLLAALFAVLYHYLGPSGGRADNRPSAAERQAQEELEALRRQPRDSPAARAEVRQKLIDFRARHAALPQALAAAALLRELPSPLDALDPGQIPAKSRFLDAPPELVAVVTGGPGAVEVALMAPDGEHLLTAARPEKKPSAVVYSDVVRGAPPRTLQKTPDDVMALALSPDGRHAAVAGRGKRLGVWDVATGQEERPLDGHGGDVLTAALSADGRWALTGGDKLARLWNLGDGGMYPLEGHAGAVTGVAFTPDGKLALSVGADRGVRLWDVDSRREPQPAVEAPAPAPLLAVAVAPDGKRAYTASDKGVRRWSLSPLAADGMLVGHDGPASALAITADARYLAAADPAAEWVGVWDLGSGQKVKNWRLPEARGVSWAIDGRHLAVAAGSRGVYVLRLP